MMKLFSKLICASALFCLASIVNAQPQIITADQSTLTQCDGNTCGTLVSDDDSGNTSSEDQSIDADNQDSANEDADSNDDSSSDQNDNDDSDNNDEE